MTRVKRGAFEERMMDLHATDALVIDFESLVTGLEIPDPNDRHVLAATIRVPSEGIVTANLRDFPEDIHRNIRYRGAAS